MADTPTPNDPEPAAKAPQDDPDAGLLAGARNPDAVKSALDAERAAAKQARQRAEAAEAKAKEYEDRDKTEAQKREEKAAEADTRAAAAELKALRFEVAASKGLDLDWASRLTGTTRKELEADAEKLAQKIAPAAPSFDGGARQAATADDVDSQIRRMAGRR